MIHSDLIWPLVLGIFRCILTFSSVYHMILLLCNYKKLVVLVMIGWGGTLSNAIIHLGYTYNVLDFLMVLCNLTKNFGSDYFTKFPPSSKAATTTNSMTKTVTSSLNKMTLNPNASSWTPNQFLAKGSSSSTSRPGFETSRPEFESSMPGFETSRTGFESWVNASEFVPQSSKPKLRPLTKTNSDVERNNEGNFLLLFFLGN